MQDEPTSYRVPDPGVRALFAEPSRYQAWLDVEAALAQAQAELGIIPGHAAYTPVLNRDPAGGPSPTPRRFNA